MQGDKYSMYKCIHTALQHNWRSEMVKWRTLSRTLIISITYESIFSVIIYYCVISKRSAMKWHNSQEWKSSLHSCLLISRYLFKIYCLCVTAECMLLHMRVPWHPVLPPQTRSPWWWRVMSKRATAQSAASSLAHIYKPDPVAAHCDKPGRTSVRGRSWKEGWTRKKYERVTDPVQTSIQ